MARSNDVRLVHIVEIIDWAIKNYGEMATRSGKNGLSIFQISHLRSLKTCIGAMPDMLVGSIEAAGPTSNLKYRYKAYRRNKKTGQLLSDVTVANHIHSLIKAISLFAAYYKMSGVPRQMAKMSKPRIVTAISRADVARILISCRGYVWDQTTSDWMRNEFNQRETVNIDKKQMKTVERIILLLVYSGMRLTCLGRLRWLPSFEGDVSYIDLEAKIEGRVGYIMKLGEDSAQGTMAEIPVKMPKRLTAHAKRWLEKDGDNRGFVIGRDLLLSSGILNSYIIDCVIERAGLSSRIGIRELKDAAAVWAIRAGSRVPKGALPFEKKPSILRSAALMRGMGYRRFRQQFGIFHDSFHRDQIEALEKLADTVR